MLLGPGAAIVAMSSGRNVERVASEPAPVGAMCLGLLVFAAYMWWMVECLEWGADHDKIRLGVLLALAPLLIPVILGAIFGGYG